MPLQETSGNVTTDAYGGGVAAVPNYIEDVFSTYLYTGSSSDVTINNGIDLSTKGGLVWQKARNQVLNNQLYDSARGTNYSLYTNSTSAQVNDSPYAFTFNSNGFTDKGAWGSSYTFASWTFRKQPKFFDVVTWTGDDVDNRVIPHALGTMPGCVITKNCDSTNTRQSWCVMHKDAGFTYSTGVADGNQLWLNRTAAAGVDGAYYSFNSASSTSLTIPSYWNQAGNLYVAYLFAHNAGGFGLTGTDNVISCGTYTGNGSATGPVITLNYEPQWLMIKKSSNTGNWQMLDNMRGMPVGSADAALRANLSDAETSVEYVSPTSAGFQITSTNTEVNTNTATYIYIAIRRGPMKVPTSGTSVFSPQIYTEILTNPTTLTTSFPTDLHMISRRTGTTTFYVADRLRGSVPSNENFLETSSTAAETDYASSPPLFTSNTGVVITALFNNISSQTDVSYQFRRAPSFFDVVCYTGTGANPTSFTHNLGVVPEMMIIKCRGASRPWPVYHVALGTGAGSAVYLDSNAAGAGLTFNTAPTSTVFTVTDGGYVNQSGQTYVNYLFATCAGVSKVFSFTGTGSLQTINCGFTSGARFVLVKRTDSTGDWYVWDSARGISSSTDPYLLLNSTAAEVTSTNWVDTTSTGFKVTAASGNNVNINGATYIGLAIA